MIRSSRTYLRVGLAAIACVLALAACTNSTLSSNSQGAQAAGGSSSPGPADTRICQVVSQATAAYNAKNYASWRADMTLIGQAADSAQYGPVKTYAEEAKRATTPTTTTTKPKSKSNVGTSFHFGNAFATVGAFVGLQHVCARLPSQ
jgi:hypothetical protein